MKKLKHANIAIFIPHNGCPNQCSFCNQKSITGKSYQPSKEDVVNILEKAILDMGERSKKAQVAFFGGSFTAIDEKYMIELLGTAFEYIKNGIFSGIRISTRPDAISLNILKLLKSKGVKSIELGAQSMDDIVLKENFRGHTSRDVKEASYMIKEMGFSLGLQMMTGLYKSDKIKDYNTAVELVKLHPDTVRIYPTVVMKNTKLAELFYSGKYNPPNVEESVELCSELLILFKKNNIDVIRLGLHDTEELRRDMIAGAWHPAFRELCESELYVKKILKSVKENNIDVNNFEILVNKNEISKIIGHKKCNIDKFKSLGIKPIIKGDCNIKKGEVILKNCR